MNFHDSQELVKFSFGNNMETIWKQYENTTVSCHFQNLTNTVF